MKSEKIKTDKKIIKDLGGATAVARLINCTPQRVQNWTVRGIPAEVKLEWPDLFLNRSGNLP